MPRTRPTTRRSSPSRECAGLAKALDDLERDRLSLAGGHDLEQRAQRLRDAAVAADDLAHIALGDVELDHTTLRVIDNLDLDGVGLVDERLCDVLDQRLC